MSYSIDAQRISVKVHIFILKRITGPQHINFPELMVRTRLKKGPDPDRGAQVGHHCLTGMG